MTLTDQLDQLAAFEPVPYPVVSLYLSTTPGQTGKDQFQSFVRKEFAARARTYAPGSPERASLEADFERIGQYLDGTLQAAANGVAIFACSAAGLFEAVQVEAPIERHWLSIGDQPHLYPLARLASQYPRYAAVLADTNSARIVVIAMGEIVTSEQVQGVKTRRSSQGGWSQARFQRHTGNFHLQHAKEVVEALDRIVQQERIEQVLLAGDEVILPLLREQMPKHLLDRVADEFRLDTHAPLSDVLRASLEAMKQVNERTDRERVDAVVDAYRAGGLATIGPDGTLEALGNGQVDELLITANPSGLHPARPKPRGDDADSTGIEPASSGEAAEADGSLVRLADELVTKARQTGARVTFIEDGRLLEDYGGVAAYLRYRI
jgi:peptide subunit release factor 1 (eRF1)